MTPTHSSNQQPPRSRSARIIAPAVIVLAAGALVFATMGQGSGTEAPTTPSAPAPGSATAAAPAPAAATSAAPTTAAPATSAAPAAPGATVPPSAIDNAAVTPPVKTAVASFITGTGQITAAPAAVDFAAVAHGSALGELEAQQQEFASNGWQLSGTVNVFGAASTSTETRDGAEAVLVTVCLDSSSVAVTDQTGATVLAAGKPGTRKNLNTYVVQEVSGKWLVVEHTFPGDTSC
ncbi:hypothetical protein ACFUCV_01380 [Specibacter sp. NPDC057265]|uniref:hypothetical protein n=1 Tax=Specibacter sp. NPDC057265 TaxID=3346075 RepID=UPI0036454830